MLRIFKSSSKRNGRKGNALLETAFVLPLLCWLILGGMQFGYYFFIKNTLQGAAREGCRSGIVLNNDNTDVTTSVARYLNSAGLNSSSTTLDAKFTLKIESPLGTAFNAGSLSAGSACFVTVQASWGNVGVLMLPPALGGLSNTKVVAGVSVMRKEG